MVRNPESAAPLKWIKANTHTETTTCMHETTHKLIHLPQYVSALSFLHPPVKIYRTCSVTVASFMDNSMMASRVKTQTIEKGFIDTPVSFGPNFSRKNDAHLHLYSLSLPPAPHLFIFDGKHMLDLLSIMVCLVTP